MKSLMRLTCRGYTTGAFFGADCVIFKSLRLAGNVFDLIVVFLFILREVNLESLEPLYI